MALRKLLRKPKLEDGSLLSVFFYCDMSVNHHMQALNHLMRTNPDNLDRRATLIKQLKDAQHNLMNVIMCIADQAIPDNRATRDFRVKYPDDVVLDQINGPIWFGAECIAAGSHIANHELESAELRPFAVHLSKVVTKLRQALRLHSISGKEEYSQKIRDMLIAFDELWADFEFRYISLMCTVKTENQYYHQQDVVVLFCESTLRAIKKKYLSYESIEIMDPSAMFAIPRLAILCGLTVYPDGPIDPSSRPSKDMPQCFRAYRQLLLRIKDLLSHLTSEQLDVLEQALCSAEGLGKLERNKLKAAAARKKGKGRHSKMESETSEGVSDSGSGASQEGRSEAAVSAEAAVPGRPLTQGSEDASGDSSREPVRRLLFEPSPVRVPERLAPMAERDLEAEVLITEPFPQFGANRSVDNELPSSTNREQLRPSTTENKLEHQHPNTATCTQSCSPTPPAPSHAISSSSSNKPKGIAGFPSAEDLMHRLFLGISGVADQLQTNHAKDLRVILKTVFTVCQSDSADEEDLGQSVMQARCSDKAPCNGNAQATLIPSSTGFNLSMAAAMEQTPSWVPDSDSPVCFMCSDRFSWKKRRHHCRGCGHENRSISDSVVRQPPAVWHDFATDLQDGVQSSLETLTSPKHIFTNSLQQSLLECSIKMGISRAELERSWAKFSEVNRRARLFLDEIAPFIPRNFSARFRNPCWEAESPNITSNTWENVVIEKFIPEFAKPKPGKGFQYSRYLMKPATESTKKRRVLCFPYFFLAGFPKSGTTTVHELFSLHPNIVSPRAKEPHWWTRALGLGRSSKISTEYIPISLMAYLLFFKSMAAEMEDPQFEELITYDGSQSTLWDSNFYVEGQDYCAMPAVMRQVLPDAKFVVVMRDPMTRLYSHFTYSCQLRHGKNVHEWPREIREGVAELFHREVVRDIELFNACAKNASVFECSSLRTANTNGPEGDLDSARSCSVIWHRLTLGMYALHVRKWLQFYPRKNFLFLRMEDFSEHSREVLSNLTEFLDIAPGYRAMSEMLREHKNSRPSAIQPMSGATSKLLRDFYQPYNVELAKILHDHRFLWED